MYSKFSDDVPGTVIGRVEVFDNGLWRTVKSTGFGSAEARVICREQGYPLDQGGTKAILPIYPTCLTYLIIPERYKYTFDPIISSPPLLQVDCAGNESSLMGCRYQTDRRQQTNRVYTWPQGEVDGYVYNACDVAIVRCNSQSRFSSDHPTVAPGYVSGNVKLWRNETWGGVCNGTINDVTAGVICREIGYPADGARALPGSTDITEKTTIIPGNLTCSGDEKSIVDCSWVHEPEEGAGTDSQCPQVAVRCMNRIRLAPEGCHEADTVRSKLELWYNGRWAPVCYEYGTAYNWEDSHAADTACSEMGYAGYAGKRSDNNRHQCSAVESAFWMIECFSEDSSLKDCSWMMPASEDINALVYCQDNVELSCLLAGDQRNNRTLTASSIPAAPAGTANTPAISRALITRNTDNILKTDNDTTAQSSSLLKVGLPVSGGVLMASAAYYMYKKLNSRKVKGGNNQDLWNCVVSSPDCLSGTSP